MHPAPRLLLLALPLLAAVRAPTGEGGAEEPVSRRLSRELTEEARLAGTLGSRRAADWVAARLTQAGWQVTIEPFVVTLALPRRISVRATTDGGTLFERTERFDPDAVPPGDVPKCSGWSASGSVRARVVDVGRGLRADFERLVAAGTDPSGAIALASYGGAYRGVKVELAEEFGCAGVLLCTPRDEEGAGRGPVFPAGPWKPGWAAQRGSISPLATCPGDPSTPGWASPAPGEEGRRVSDAERDAHLPHVPCTPLSVDEGEAVRAALARGEAVEVELAVDMPRDLRTIWDVIGRLPGKSDRLVLAGNHRDAWVRGAQDAGSGTVSLLRAAQHLGERARAGWTPGCTIVLGFWDAEELGLIGSTEWGEEHAAELEARALAYVNADAVVSGLHFGASGTPGLVGVLERALAEVPAPDGAMPAPKAEEPGAGAGGSAAGASPATPTAGAAALGSSGAVLTLDDAWRAGFDDGAPRFSLPGSGSDHTVFLHHLGIPVIDLGFGGNGGGQYHTVFDGFAQMDRFLDPGWVGHETAGKLLAALLADLADEGRAAFDDAAAARALARQAREAGAETGKDGAAWLGPERGERLAAAFERLADAVESVRGSGRGSQASGEDGAPRSAPASAYPAFYAGLAAPQGLPGRPWYTNRLWAPGLETGYAAETFPGLRVAAKEGGAALERELSSLVGAVDRLADAWLTLPPLPRPRPRATPVTPAAEGAR